MPMGPKVNLVFYYIKYTDDAHCVSDALISGVNGLVAMADFFGYSPVCGSNSSLPPVIEASAALYHLLSAVDSFLYSHLDE